MPQLDVAAPATFSNTTDKWKAPITVEQHHLSSRAESSPNGWRPEVDTPSGVVTNATEDLEGANKGKISSEDEKGFSIVKNKARDRISHPYLDPLANCSNSNIAVISLNILSLLSDKVKFSDDDHGNLTVHDSAEESNGDDLSPKGNAKDQSFHNSVKENEDNNAWQMDVEKILEVIDAMKPSKQQL